MAQSVALSLCLQDMVNSRGREITGLLRGFPVSITKTKTSLLYTTMPLALAAASLLAPTPLSASGYGVREWSAVAMGSAYAGASATSSDSTFLAYNPASLAGVG